MKLSILMCAIPERERHQQMEMLSSHPDVEVISICDNKKRTVGRKRQDLLNLAQGDYITYLDDDDYVADDYIERVLDLIEWGADLINYYVDCEHFGKHSVVHSSIHYENEEYNPGGITRRKPTQIQVWRRWSCKRKPFSLS